VFKDGNLYYLPKFIQAVDMAIILTLLIERFSSLCNEDYLDWEIPNETIYSSDSMDDITKVSLLAQKCEPGGRRYHLYNHHVYTYVVFVSVINMFLFLMLLIFSMDTITLFAFLIILFYGVVISRVPITSVYDQPPSGVRKYKEAFEAELAKLKYC